MLFGLLTYILLSEMGLSDLIPLLRRISFQPVIYIVIGAMIGAARREKWVLGAMALSAVLWLIVAYSPLAARLAQPLPLQASAAEIARGADAVIVLSSRIQDDGEFTKDSLARLMRGLELVRSGRAPVLVLTELRPPSGSYTAATKNLTTNLKMPINIVTIKGPVIDTHDEAVAMAKLAKQRGWKRIFLVTAPTHTRRGALVFRHAARAQKLTVLPVAAQETTSDLQTLSEPGQRLHAFDMAIHEIIGIWVYKRRGWIA